MALRGLGAPCSPMAESSVGATALAAERKNGGAAVGWGWRWCFFFFFSKDRVFVGYLLFF